MTTNPTCDITNITYTCSRDFSSLSTRLFALSSSETLPHVFLLASNTWPLSSSKARSSAFILSTGCSIDAGASAASARFFAFLFALAFFLGAAFALVLEPSWESFFEADRRSLAARPPFPLPLPLPFPRSPLPRSPFPRPPFPRPPFPRPFPRRFPALCSWQQARLPLLHSRRPVSAWLTASWQHRKLSSAWHV